MAKKTVKKTASRGNEAKREYAYFLYMAKTPQKDIATRVGVTEKTITRWKEEDGWEIKRAAKNISMDVLISKALKRINELLDEEKFDADAFSKSVAQLKTLKTGITVDDEIMALLAFQNFLIENRLLEDITEELIQQIVKLQDIYIQIRLGNG